MSSIWMDLFGTPFKQEFKNVNGINTRYIEAGEGPTLIFLHGTGGHLEAYCRNIREHSQHFRTIAMDMIGHGLTDKPNDPYEIPLYAQHVIDFMDSMGIEKAHISGESLGGWVGAYLAIHYPDRLNKLVLNTAGGLTANPEVMERLKTLTRQAVTSPNRDNVQKRLEFLMYDKASVTQELVDVRFTIYSNPRLAEVVDQLLVLQEMDIRKRNMLTEAQLSQVQASTLVIWTTHDPTAPASVGARFAEAIPKASLHVIEEAGHWPQFEKPEEFNKVHISFLLEGE